MLFAIATEEVRYLVVEVTRLLTMMASSGVAVAKEAFGKTVASACWVVVD